jgi:hypothetical protein
MKYIFLLVVLVFELFGGVVRSPVVSVNEDESLATIEIDKIDVGMSGFIVHRISKNHTSILKNAVVKSFDKKMKRAVLSLSDYDSLRQNALPNGEWHVEVGDVAVLAFGYTRGVLIAPSDEIYYRITKATKQLQWIHPDIFATILSFNGHPTPLREDFTALSKAASVGLIFIYINEKLYMVDSKTFKILNISDVPLKQKSVKLPFYTRVEQIEAAWWGEGSDELKSYEPHYFELLKEANPNNKKLLDEIEKFAKKGIK